MKFDPDFKDFAKPQWEEWELNEHKDLAIKIKKFLTYGDQFAKNPDLDDEKLLPSDLRNDPFFINNTMYYTQIDINNDGDAENVILYYDGRCLRTRPFAKSLLVLNEDKTLIDVKKTDPLVRNRSWDKSLSGRIASNNFNSYDIFSYKGKIFISHYFGVGRFCEEPLSIYVITGNKAEEICSYKTMIWCK